MGVPLGWGGVWSERAKRGNSARGVGKSDLYSSSKIVSEGLGLVFFLLLCFFLGGGLALMLERSASYWRALGG